MSHLPTGSEGLQSTLRWGFAGVIALLGLIAFLLVNQDQEPAAPTRLPIAKSSSPAWSDSLERKCRAIHSRFKAVQAKMDYMESSDGDRDGDGAIDDQALYVELFQVRRPQLESQLYDTCATNQDLWEQIRSSW